MYSPDRWKTAPAKTAPEWRLVKPLLGGIFG
jgi:hypothetical protein